jgi:hypothetical protein
MDTEHGLHKYISDAILMSPFEATILSKSEGPNVAFHFCQTTLQPSKEACFVFLRCESRLDSRDGVQMLLRPREGFRVVSAMNVHVICTWEDDEIAIPFNAPTWDGQLTQASPWIIQQIKPDQVGVSPAPSSHYNVFVRIDLRYMSARGGPQTTAEQVIEIEREKLKETEASDGPSFFKQLQEPIALHHARNLEVAYRVFNIRLDCLSRAALSEPVNRGAVRKACDWLRVNLIDRLQGPHFDEKRRERAKELMSLASSFKRRRRAPFVAPDSPRPTLPVVAYYLDGDHERFVKVIGLRHNDHSGTYYVITWTRHTLRENLRHLDGVREISRVDCHNKAIEGTRLLYTKETTEVVTVEKNFLEGEAPDETIVKFQRETHQDHLSPKPIDWDYDLND